MKLISSRAFFGVIPLTCTLPSLTGLSPDTSLSSVDLPHPDGPRNVTNSPRSTFRETLSSATAPSRKRLLTPPIAISGIDPDITMATLPPAEDRALKDASRNAEPAVSSGSNSSCPHLPEKHWWRGSGHTEGMRSLQSPDAAARPLPGQRQRAPTRTPTH